jgi:xanthine dehydrogenase small subunit
LGAQLILRKGSKTREVLLDQFYTGQKQNILQKGEFIESVILPKISKDQIFKAHKISKRFEQDISATCAAILYEIKNGQLKNVRLAYNGLAPSPCRAPKIEAVLEGRSSSQVTEKDLDAAIASSFVARDGLRATWTYRALVARNLILQFIQTPQHEEASL